MSSAPAGQRDAEPSPLDGTLARQLTAPMTRRQFVARAAALAVSASALGAVLETCAQATAPTRTPTPMPSPAPVITPGTTFRGAPPVIDPAPTLSTVNCRIVGRFFVRAKWH